MTLDSTPVVLVVDDDRTQVALVSSVLKKAGFRVLSADSPTRTVAVLDAAGEARRGISLLVTDLDMPDMDGLTLAAELVRKHPTLKVLYITAHPDGLFKKTHELKPNEAFLEKPVSAQLLREAVNLLLREAERPFGS
jgi:two-component system cell cycle sensor histidine kinase/response regulator CckA